LTNPNSIQKIASGNTNLADKIVSSIRTAKAQIKDKFSSPYANKQGVEMTYSQLNEAEKLWNNALQQTAENKGNVSSDNVVRNSIIQKDNGDYKIIADRDIFKDVAPEDRNTVLKNFINENIRGNQYKALTDSEVLNVAQKNKTVQKLYRPGIPMNSEKYAARQELVSHYDEALEASKKTGTQEAKNDKHNQTSVDKRNVEIEIPKFNNDGKLDGSSVWEAEISVLNDTKTAYDNSKLKDITKDAHSDLRNLQNANPNIDRASLADMVSQQDNFVKRNEYKNVNDNSEPIVKNSLKENTSSQQTKSDTNMQEGNGDDAIQGDSNNVLNEQDVKDMQSIGRKSVNDFASEDIEKTKNVAKKYYAEMGNKSPFFRSWFGDWRENDTTPVHIVTEKDNARGVKVNKDTGWDIQISGKVFNETKIHQSSSAKNAIGYLNYINSIVENAILLDSYTIPSKSKKSENSVMMHSLYDIADMGNGNELIKLYVEELNNINADGTIKRAYQLQNISKAPVASVRVQGKSFSSLTNTTGADTYTVSDLFNLVKQYDKNFKPQQASKVVNEDGTPKVMYRGGNDEINVFDRKKSSYANLYGKGFYFTDSKSHASQYGNVQEYYLDIKNPLNTDDKNISKKQLHKFLEAVAENEDDYDIWNYGTTDIDEITNTLYGKGDFEMLQDVSATAIGDLVETVELFNKVNNTNYDGFILPTETVVFNSNQIKSATDNVGSFDKNNPDIRYSLKENTNNTAEHKAEQLEIINEIYDYTKSFSEQVEDWKQGKIPKYDSLLVGETPEVFKKIGFNPLPMTINQTHIDYAINGTKDIDHALGEDLLKQLPQKIKEPVAIIESQTQNGKSVVALLDFKHNGKTVISPVEIDGYGTQNNVSIDSNAITSIFGKGNAVTKLLNDALTKETSGDMAVYYLDNKKAAALLQTAGLQLPSHLFRNSGYIHSIRENGSNVKPRIENITYSQQFKRWFGDWEKSPHSASKVVDEDGEPLTVYHGTAEEFFTFDKTQGGRNTDAPSAKKAFFFTDDERIAEGYAEDSRPKYIDDLRRRAERLDNQSVYRWNLRNEAERAYEEYEQAELDYNSHGIVMGVYLNMRNPYIVDYNGSQYRESSYADNLNYALKHGYDGVIFKNTFDSSNKSYDEASTIYAVFNPEQIKSATDNVGTFDKNNPDIRYSLKENSTAENMADELIKMKLLRSLRIHF
jgi:hypothetical protein